MKKVTKDFLAKYLSDLYVSTLTSQPSDVDFTVEVSYQGTELYKFEELYSHLLVPPLDKQKNDLTEVLDKSGIFELEVEFNPASEASININNGRGELQEGTYIPFKIRSSDPSFRRWFQQVCSLLGSIVYLIMAL